MKKIIRSIDKILSILVSSSRAILLSAALCGMSSAVAIEPNRHGTRNDPNFRENAPPAYFPNSAIPPKYPEPKPQTHGLDLSKHDGETAKAYFKWLCENEAGEFIYKTVENVESVFEMRRPPGDKSGSPRYDRYYLEDPWGSQPRFGWSYGIIGEYDYVMPSTYRRGDMKGWTKKGDYFRYQPESGFPVLERISTTLDRKRYGDAPFVRFTRVWPTHPEYDRDEQGNIRMFQLREYLNGPSLERRTELSLSQGAYFSPDRGLYDEQMLSSGYIIPKVEATHSIKSRYGFMWRGIERSPDDRELGIGGGEILVFDLRTNEVLGVRRNFVRAFTYAGSRDLDWLTAQECRDYRLAPSLQKNVLKPIDPYKNLNIK